MRLLYCGFFLLLFALVCRADIITVKSAELIPEDEHYLLNAEFEFAINSTLEEALLRGGFSLHFVLEFELRRPRWYWLDERIAEKNVEYKLSYSALTRQYRLSSGLYTIADLASLDDVIRLLSKVRARPVAEKSTVKKGNRYEAAVRFRLDTSKLPKPFQLEALASRDWNLQSEWQRWIITP